MGHNNLNKSETARIFGVSLTCLSNWRRKGCPENLDGTMDAGSVAEWRELREANREGITSPLLRRYACLRGEIIRRRVAHDKHVADINAITPDGDEEDLGPRSVMKVMAIAVAILKRELLFLPDKFLQKMTSEDPNDPVAIIASLHDAVVDALDELGGDQRNGSSKETDKGEKSLLYDRKTSPAVPSVFSPDDE